jgi:hypothetical protein
MKTIEVSWWCPGNMFTKRWHRTFPADPDGVKRALALGRKLRDRGRAYNIIIVSQHG